MPRVTTLECDGCGISEGLDETVMERGAADVIQCDTCFWGSVRKMNGQPFFVPTEGYTTARDEVSYGGPYPQLREKGYSCEVESQIKVDFFGHALTPEEALSVIDLVKGVDATGFRPSWDHPDIDWAVRVTWRDVPLEIVEDAIDEFLKPALGLINDDGEAVTPSWMEGGPQ